MKSSILIVALSGLFAAATPLQARNSGHDMVQRAVSSCGQARSAQPEPEPQPEPEAQPEPIQAPAINAVTDAAYTKIVLDHHNLHRSNHSARALTWDNTLAQWAQNIAVKCVFAHDMNQGGGGYGQNLAAYASTAGNLPSLKLQTAANGVTEQWYNGEMPNWPASAYGQANPPPNVPLDKWGHFTQVVWASTTKVGCFSQLCPAGKILAYPTWFMVCNYRAPGNYGGQYGKNVLRPLGHATVHANV